MSESSEQATVLAVPLDLLATPRDGSTLTDRWWVVRDGQALFWRRKGSRGWSPQCNHDRRLPEQLVERLHPGATVEFVSVAHLGPWNDEWGHMLTPALIEAGTQTDSPTAAEGEQ